MHIRRNHDAFTFGTEKRLLDLLAGLVYRYTNADQLSLLALGGACAAGISYILAGAVDLVFLHLASLGVTVHWFGDSLDGRVARLRGEGRPKYGHYLDHLLDALSLSVIVFGINYSGLTYQSSWVWVLVLFLLIMIHSFLKASVTGVFELTLERFGPTEARIGLIVINTSAFFWDNRIVLSAPFPMTFLDVWGIAVSALLGVNLLRAVADALWGRGKIVG